MKTPFIVSDFVGASEASGFLPFTFGMRKYKQTAIMTPEPPTTQKGKPNPPALYSADPKTGPGNK